jgi:single-strand DNA-binding protein
MSGTLNKVMLIGHLGDDVKIHYFEGRALFRFGIST